MIFCAAADFPARPAASSRLRERPRRERQLGDAQPGVAADLAGARVLDDRRQQLPGVLAAARVDRGDSPVEGLDVASRQIDGCRCASRVLRASRRTACSTRRRTRSSRWARSPCAPSSAGIAATSGSRSALSGNGWSRAARRRVPRPAPRSACRSRRTRSAPGRRRGFMMSLRSSWWIRPSVCPHSCRNSTISLCALRSV